MGIDDPLHGDHRGVRANAANSRERQIKAAEDVPAQGAVRQ